MVLKRMAVPVVLAVSLAAAGCGGSSGGDGTSPSGRNGLVAYSRCMRAHGVSAFPDPNAQGDLQVNAGPGTGIDPSSATYKAADGACKKLLPQQHQSPAEKAQHLAQALKYSKCMRAHGVPSFPDPNRDGGIAIQASSANGLDPNSPQFKAADQACRHFVGKPGGGTLNEHVEGGKQ